MQIFRSLKKVEKNPPIFLNDDTKSTEHKKWNETWLSSFYIRSYCNPPRPIASVLFMTLNHLMAKCCILTYDPAGLSK